MLGGFDYDFIGMKSIAFSLYESGRTTRMKGTSTYPDVTF